MSRMEIEFIDRYTGMTGVPCPWRACPDCAALGIDIDASTEEQDVPCPTCGGSCRRPWQGSLLDLPWRLGKALRFAWRHVLLAEGGFSRRIALGTIFADFRDPCQ